MRTAFIVVAALLAFRSVATAEDAPPGAATPDVG
jgi:hypothetical protein